MSFLVLPIRPLCQIIFWCLVVLPTQAETFDQCADTQRLLKRASSIRGLSVKTSVPCQVADREGVREYLLKTIAKQLPPERLAKEEMVYKELGFLPQEYNYAKGIVDLYLSQIGAYYDPELDHYVMASWLYPSMQREITVHDLTHALQDQHFDLNKIMDYQAENGDMLLARAALVEGDANLVMLEFGRGKDARKGPLSDIEVQAYTAAGVLDASIRSSAEGAPKSLQMVLIFPYTSGLRFTHLLRRDGGYKAVTDAYKKLPASTEEILHPEKYHAEIKDFKEFSESDLRTSDVPADYKLQYQDTLGEFGLSALLSMYADKNLDPAKVSRGWGGDKITLFGRDDQPERIIAWRSAWDTDEDAAEFLSGYAQVLRTKYSMLMSSSDTWVSGADGRQAKIFRQNKEVHCVIKLRKTD